MIHDNFVVEYSYLQRKEEVLKEMHLVSFLATPL